MACIILSGSLHAATETLVPVEDAVIQGGTFSSEILRGPTLTVTSRGTDDRSYVRKIMLLFQTEERTAKNITAARLTLSCLKGSSATIPEAAQGTVMLALFGAVGSDWSEKDLTWGNAPFHAQSSASEENNDLVTPLAELVVDPAASDFSGNVTFSDARLVEFVRNNPGNVTFIVTGQGGPQMPGLRFFDREGASDPSLKPSLILETE